MSLHIEVDVPQQRLRLLDTGADVLLDRVISTAAKGVGEQVGSECTPRGRHIVRAKIGAGAAPNAVFVGRRPTGEIYSPELRRRFPGRDWILTRILWLSGMEPGFNRSRDVDTMRRYIYIHGAPDDDVLGQPSSHGCVKMRNQDVIELFERVPVGTVVAILDATPAR